MAREIKKAVQDAALAQKLAKEAFTKNPTGSNLDFIATGCALITAVKKRDDYLAANRDKFLALRRVFSSLRQNGDKSGIQDFCLKSKVKGLKQWGESMRDLGGVLLHRGKSATLCNKPIAAFLGMISILRDHGEKRVVHFMERELRGWIRETPASQWGKFLIHPVTRDVVVRLRVADNVASFSNLKKMGLGAVYTEQGRGILLDHKDATFEVKLDAGGLISVSRASFYFESLPF
jgi:hypothetical protein